MRLAILMDKRPKCKNRPSIRGVLLRELIALGVRATKSDILDYVQKYNKYAHINWRQPRGCTFKRIWLPDGVHAGYLVPKNSARKDVAILQLHGGGYKLGYFSFFKRFAVKLAKLGGNIPVLILDYRVAPDHPYPAALEDAINAVKWLEREEGIRPESIAAVGESCGAGLALALAMRLRDSGLGSLGALVLMSPWTDLTCAGGSYANRYHMDPLFGRKMPMPDDEKRTFIGRAYAGDHDLKDPYLSPVFGDFTSLPPMLIQVGEYEMLYDDSDAIYKKALSAGVQADFKAWPGMFHVFQLADGFVPESRAAWSDIGAFIRRHLGKH